MIRWKNHESSKKHKDKVAMLREEVLLDADVEKKLSKDAVQNKEEMEKIEEQVDDDIEFIEDMIAQTAIHEHNNEKQIKTEEKIEEDEQIGNNSEEDDEQFAQMMSKVK